MAEDFNATASTLIGEKRLDEAKALLEQALAEKPADWRPVLADEDEEVVYCWDMQEFLACCAESRKDDGRVVWVHGSYSRACYLLAYIAVEQRNAEAAFQALQKGLELEPDHPHLWCEMGHLLQLLQRHDEALQCYVRAEGVRAWATSEQKGRALRGQGINLIDLGRLDEAEAALKRSLEVEPENPNALHELGYIAHLRRQAEGQSPSLDSHGAARS
ncbi:MAG: tetratricopeptide repeat protein [Acidobacteria bacterium]|nr:tetratricopeptide repeat protein [Acidobacteriota bacterium]